MSTFSKPFFQIHAGIEITPDSSFVRAGNPIKLAAEILSAPAVTAGYAARIIFGNSTNNCHLNSEGNVTVSASGTRQIESLSVNSAVGVTDDGTLIVTVTKTDIIGPPTVVVQVPLKQNTHTTNAAIAGAIADALAANGAIAEACDIDVSGSVINVRSKYPLDNDATFNISIAAGLGVLGVPSSNNSVAGVSGSVIERLGLNGTDALGQKYPPHLSIEALVVSVPDYSRNGIQGDGIAFTIVEPGRALATMVVDGLSYFDCQPIVGPAIVDFLILTK